MRRHLALKSEYLTDLSTDELSSIAGGPQDPRTLICLTGVYPTINTPCRTTDCFVIQSLNEPCPSYAC